MSRVRSDAAVHLVAASLGMHAVQVEDMVSFYAFLNREPKGRFDIRLSKTPVSLMKGAAEVAHAFAKAAGVSIGGTSPDGEFTVEWTNDIGMADQEPSALINGTVVTALTPADAPAIVAALRQRQAGNTLPLLSGSDVQGMALPQARVESSLVQRGLVVFQQGRRGDPDLKSQAGTPKPPPCARGGDKGAPECARPARGVNKTFDLRQFRLSGIAYSKLTRPRQGGPQ